MRWAKSKYGSLTYMTRAYMYMVNAENRVILNGSVFIIVAVIDNVCNPLFEKKCKSPESTKMRTATYDHECEIKRMHFFDKLNKYRKDKSDINRVEMVRARSYFKSSVRKYKRECMKQKTNKLINTRFKDAKGYWNC